ncbi:MAG: DNA polymerase I [Nanohaloarchaea archaeon]|nr:DNA polymerase I [Candidatus Nanohaloarchaea archaeon]
MVFNIDFCSGKPVEWSKQNGKPVKRKIRDYRPRFYVNGSKKDLVKLRKDVAAKEGVKSTCFEFWKPDPSFYEKQEVLRIDCSSEPSLKKTAYFIARSYRRGRFRLYNVGLSPQFRYCLQKEIEPVPNEQLEVMELELPRKNLANKQLSELEVNGTKTSVNELETKLDSTDPDILIVDRGKLLKLLQKEMDLGRSNGFEMLAGENTVSSYGKTVHSSARYNVPGRALIDKSNSFLYGEATLQGLWDLVSRSYRPIQELAWGSIGRILTSIEIRKAYIEKDVLKPWKKWSGEKPKKASKLHKADRGGFIFNPEPSIHENVYEADFASLFPNIMIEKNISPETVCCDCCNNLKVPELDFSICENRRGFIPEVLKPLVEDRQRMKEIVDGLEGRKKKEVQGSIDAIKWLLVSCFGYMGHKHASFGAIRCHQAIQAFDREIMLRTKNMFEENGYSVAHGIIDSIWVQKREEPKDFQNLCGEISDEIGILLESEHKFEWCAFVPRSSSKGNIATLNRYFGKKKSGGFKTAGIEMEQRSTSKFIKNAQEEMIEALDCRMDAADVLKVVEKRSEELESMKVDPKQLVKKRSVSKKLESYSVENRSVAAIKRAKKHGIEVKPGQNVSYVVRDDRANSLDRLRLDFELDTYDSDYYREELFRAAESVLSPLGWEKESIEREVSGSKQKTLRNL